MLIIYLPIHQNHCWFGLFIVYCSLVDLMCIFANLFQKPVPKWKGRRIRKRRKWNVSDNGCCKFKLKVMSCNKLCIIIIFLILCLAHGLRKCVLCWCLQMEKDMKWNLWNWKSEDCFNKMCCWKPNRFRYVLPTCISQHTTLTPRVHLSLDYNTSFYLYK
jgi:hypothetical protein